MAWAYRFLIAWDTIKWSLLSWWFSKKRIVIIRYWGLLETKSATLQKDMPQILANKALTAWTCREIQLVNVPAFVSWYANRTIQMSFHQHMHSNHFYLWSQNWHSQWNYITKIKGSFETKGPTNIWSGKSREYCGNYREPCILGMDWCLSVQAGSQPPTGPGHPGGAMVLIWGIQQTPDCCHAPLPSSKGFCSWICYSCAMERLLNFSLAYFR